MWMLRTFSASMLLSGAVIWFSTNDTSRAPASTTQTYELEIQKINLSVASSVRSLDEAFVRVTVDNQNIFEFHKDDRITMKTGDTRRLDLNLPVQQKWIKND